MAKSKGGRVMYVQNHMLKKEKLTALSSKETLKVALSKLREGDFLSLPVFDGDTFTGVIFKESIYRNYFESEGVTKEAFLNDWLVSDIMKTDYDTIHLNEPVEHAAYVLQELKTPFLVVKNEQEKFVGILTHKAIFNAYANILGIHAGHRIVLNMFDLPGQLAKLTAIVKENNGNITNLAVEDAKVMNVQKVVLKVKTNNINRLIEAIKAAGFKVSDLDMA